ncbi:MAG TPA: hypothetical protein VLW52_05815, partial [Opitutaceae bacterium]|nr:hypothetical protein [Opitutaceae bacterium]
MKRKSELLDVNVEGSPAALAVPRGAGYVSPEPRVNLERHGWRMIRWALPALLAAAARAAEPRVAGFINEHAPYPECHAATIAETAPGHLVAAWFGGTKERNPDV